MKYVLLIYQGTTPLPTSPEAWATLSEDEQKAVYADYARHQPHRRRHRRASSRSTGAGNDCAGQGREDHCELGAVY